MNYLLAFIIPLLLVIIVYELIHIFNIHRKFENNGYEPIIEIIKQHIPKSAILVSSYPQIISLETGNNCIGTSFLIELLPDIINRHSPDYIIIDSVYWISNNNTHYDLFYSAFNGSIKGYKTFIEDKQQKFIILKRTNI